MNGSPTCTFGRFCCDSSLNSAEASKRCAVNSVASRFRADVNHRIARAAVLSRKIILRAGDAQRQRVHQRIIRVARLEHDFAAHCRHAETISVKSDAANHAIQNVPVARDFFRRGISRTRPRGDRAETQRIEHGNRPRAHGENIAQNPAHAGRRALKRFDEARMIVRFDLEYGHQAVADIHHARILSRALHHVRARASAGVSDARAMICRSSARSTSR